MAKIPKRKRNFNAFGEELYVPEIDIPEFDTDLGFATDDIDVENLDLFDYDREDNNSDVRYMRPRPARTTLHRRRCVPVVSS